MSWMALHTLPDATARGRLGGGWATTELPEEGRATDMLLMDGFASYLHDEAEA